MSNASATLTASDDRVDTAGAGAFLYLLLECGRPWAGGARFALSSVDAIRLGRGQERRYTRSAEDGPELSVEIPDAKMSSRHARVVRLASGWVFEDLDSKNGSRVRGAATKRTTLHDGDVIEVGETLFLFKEEPRTGEDLSEASDVAPGLATFSPTLALEHDRIAAVAASGVPVLIIGETGTGKELAASAVHRLSRRSGRFVAVNCGALPASLVEAELFGHRQGAFSGSVEARPGLVRTANKGTLFLDEIGDLPLSSQAALLRVLQEKEVLPVGETVPVKVDVRVIAATHRNLRALAESGSFRPDLLARLEGYTARLAPLRERRCDLGLLIATLLERIAPDRTRQITFHPAAARALVACVWPGNVRELEQALGAAVALAHDGVIRLEHLPEALREAPSGPASARSKPKPTTLSPEDEALRDQLVSLLEEHRGSINGVARVMGKDRTQIKRWMARFEIDADRWR